MMGDGEMVVDMRKVFIVSLIGSYYTKQPEEIVELFENEELMSFLDDPTATLLTARLTPQSQGLKIVLDNKANLEEDDESVLLFYKKNGEFITPENIHKQVGTVSLNDSPTVTLYQMLKKAFIPGLFKNSKANKNVDHKLQDPIAKLEQALSADIQSNQTSTTGKPKGITSISDEKSVWSTAPNYAKNANEKEIAAWIFNLIDSIDKELKSVTDWSSGTQIFGTILNCLDDIWKMGEKYYPESRMIHLLDIVGHEIMLIVQTALKAVNLWDTPFNDLEKHLLWGMTMCDKYIDMCHNLTGMLWPSDASRQFHRGEYTPSITANYSDRLKGILRIRSVHKQLVSLVTMADAEILHPKKCFVPFAGTNPIFYNVYTEPLWKHAVEKFEKLIVPAEASISSRLLAKLNVEANAFQLLAEYKRYKELIMRPKVAHAVLANREQLLIKLIGVAEKIKTEFMEKKPTDSSLTKNVSPVIASIYYARKSLYRMKDIENIADAVLKDLNGYDELASQLIPIKNEIETFENQAYNTWLTQVTEAISNKELTLTKNDAVIEFSDGRLMEVTYNPKMVNMIDEAQQLATMGFRITREIQDAVVEAKKFLKQAKELDQIANFHNTIGDRMIPSQRPMMLEAAVALSKLVQTQNGITWDDGDDVESYITSLKNLVNILAKQNNLLSQFHIQVKNKVKILFETDLMKQQQKWKTIMQELRQIFVDVQDQGYRNMKSWESHWDRQLYKVLEVKYVQGMMKVHESLPEIHVELVYRQQKLQFKPPLEEVRMKYYTNLKRFLVIPKQFRGVTDENPDDLIFGLIVTRNCHRFEKLYRDAEQCLTKAAATKNRFEDWVALGSADIDVISKECLITWEDWDRNFKTSKAKGQEISRLQTADEKIGCIIISFAVLRFEIELLNRKYWEVLVTLLQNSIIQEMATAETFLNDATEKLRVQPSTVEEIATANVLEEQLASQVPETRNLLESIDKKNKTLATWTKDRTDLSRIKGLWENFLSLFENHQFLIGRQVEAIKGNLEQQVKGLNEEAEVFKIRWDEFKPKEGEIDNGSMKLDDIIQFIHEKREEWNLLVERRSKIMDSCLNIGLDDADFPLAHEIEDDLKKVEDTWLQLEEFKEGLKEYEQEEWIVFRTRPQRLEEFLVKWETQFRSQDKSDVIVRILKDVESYKSFIPNLKYIRGDSFTEKHWYELFNILKIPSKQLGHLKVEDFLKARNIMEDHLKEIQELNLRAAGEITVRQALNELDAWEIEAKFDLAETLDAHKKSVYVIQDFKSLLNKVGDNQSLLQSIRTSPFYSHFADRISVWETRLGDLDEFIQNLNKVQRRWIYLEPIFSQGVLESEQQRFRRINEEYRGIMDSIGIDNRVVGLCKIQGIRNRLNMLVDQLSRCQNSLNEFLETKRSGFPRFYFLGDDDLLEILGQSTKPNVIQAHLKKLFAGIYNVEFDGDFEFITAMKSVEEEIVPLKSKVKITSNVEEWLSELANEMKYTLKSNLLDSISETKRDSREVDKYPSQILTLCNAIQFNDRCEEAIRSTTLTQLRAELKVELESYTNTAIPDSHPNPKVLELKYKDLILDTIHEIDIVEFLLNESVKNVTEWCWQKQLRFYLRDDGCAVVKMADAEFVYSYEYQGNAPKLVHTPLTDKCYLTLTQGMRMGLGGNPYGPAGTGKTESVKALGGLLGRQVLVFNCDEGIDVKAMGRIFVGLVKCGAWGCFDEVNRLEGATLSAVSMQIQPIQIALKNGLKTVKLMDETVLIDSNAGIFVTLNPAGKGYGGRNKLPDNLKQLFRPVVMSQPDNELIAEVILYTEGFKNAKKIGRKLVEIFKLSAKLLTPQTHYDWGLRALKTVLKGCGTALKEYKLKNFVVSEEEESDIVVATLRLNTLPKLTYADCFRFDHLIKDVFPSVTFKDLGHHDLADNVREVCHEMKLTVNENQVKKCLELYEQLKQRMGVVVVGPSCCGKTTIVSLLKNALLRMGQKIKTHFINPKSILRTQLLGQINLDTRQWTDGVLTLKAQQVYAEPPDITSWIICDGDVDPEWVESLNSVLDDNRLLTLPSGWRIKFGSNVNFIFETHDLSYASPATISRMGMIFMSEEDADLNGIIATWLAEETSNRDTISQLIDDYFYKGINWILPQYDVIIQLPLVSIVKNALSQMRGVQNASQMAVAMIRGFTGHLSTNMSMEFAGQVLNWTGISVPKGWNLLNLYYSVRTMSLEVFEDEELQYSDDYSIESPPLVQTTDVKQIMDLVKPWLENRESFLLVGPEGSGKSMILEYAFSQMRSTEVAVVHCSGLVSPQHVLQKLTQYCITVSTNTGRVYKSKDGDRLVLYFKDLNLVKPDKWGTCQLVEFLQQVINYKGFYDSNLEWVGIEGVQIAASINPGVSSAKYALSPRFTSIVRVGSMGDLLRPQLETICKSYMSVFLQWRYPTHSIHSSPDQIRKLSRTTIQFYESMKTMFRASNQNHYQFTPRDLTKWILGLMRYQFNDEAGHIQEIVEAWTYETCRMFRDKLVSPKEKDNFDKALTVLVADDWGITEIIEKLDGFYYVSDVTRGEGSSQEPTKFKRGVNSCLGKVNEMDLESIVEKGLNIYGREYRNLSLVIFPEVLQNVANFERALSARHGSMVLAGRSGVGRRTAVSIVSALHGAIPFTLKVGRNYTVKNFKMDLKTAVQLSAVEGNKVYFVIEDFQLVDVIFLDMLNSLLSSGEVPGLYTPEELDGIISPLREAASLEGHTSSLYAYFAGRVKQLLRIILIMDFTNEHFLRNCESNPAIYKQCFFLWMDVWSSQSLSIIPSLIIDKYYRKKVEKKSDAPNPKEKETKRSPNEAFMKGFLRIYESLEPSMSSPRRYIALIHNYASLFNQRTKHIAEQMSRLSAGVSKLAGAKEVVERLKIDAAEQEVVLAKKQAEANKALELITETMRNANIQRGEVQNLREQTAKENEILEQKKKSIDSELRDIEPEVKKAQASVGSIKNEAISEIRSLRAPPEVIRDILEAVLRLMGIMDMSWNSMKLFLSQRGIKEEIRNFDARKIKRKDRDAVEKLLQEKPDSFTDQAAKRASAAAAPLATWVMANVKYSRALEKIEPLERQQILIRQGLEAAEGQLGQLSSELMDVDKRVEHLKANLNQFTKEAAETEIRLGRAKETLVAAEGLVGKLEDEFTRWSKRLTEYAEELKRLPTKTLLAAGFITYLSEASEDIREYYVQIWSKSLKASNFSLLDLLSTEKELRHWQALGLPSDRLSLENGLIINQLTDGQPGTSLRPYLIDPTSRAGEWLRASMEINNPVVSISLHDSKFPHELELSVRFGKVMIVTEADCIEPILIPILRGDIMCQGTREMVQIGDKYVDMSPTFRIFMITRNPSPKIPPDAASVITTVNFTTTNAGLTSQLMTNILEIEKPELREKNTVLIKNVEDMKMQLSEMGDQLLQELANAQGNILENQDLLNSLNRTKENSIRIENSLAEQSKLEASLNKEINVYLPLAEFASLNYFALLDLAKLNKAYQFSLNSFIHLFVKTLRAPNKTSSTDVRISSLQQELESAVFDHVCRCLFKENRLAFAMSMAHAMHPKLFNESEWEAFTGQLVTDMNAESLNTFKQIMPSWINEDRIIAVLILKTAFPALYDKLNFVNANLWNEFYTSNECEEHLPQGIKDTCTAFQTLMIIQTLRPDRLHTAMTSFARYALGRRFLFPPPMNISQVFLDTIAEEPILLLIQSGADPSQELMELAHVTVGSDNYFEISMGQGQSQMIIEKLNEAAEKGYWICLKNLHLITHWLDSLEKEIQKLKPNPRFRLWLTSEPHQDFPTVLAQTCLKIAYEAPQGLKKNLQQTYGNWSEEYVTGDKNILRIQSLLVLAIFHAVVQERRTFIPQGWSKFYEFNESDIRAGADVLDQIFKGSRSKEIQWQYVRGLFENAIYGGRVDNVYDVRVLVSYLDEYFNDLVLTGASPSRKTLCFGLKIPSSTNAQDYLDVINSMPEFDKPVSFGLPGNIERSWQRVVSSQVINQLKVLSRIFTDSVRYDRNIWYRELSPILNLWKKLVQGSSVATILQLKTTKSFQPETNNADPIEAFVHLEYFTAIKILKFIHAHLGSISKTIRGSTTPSSMVFEIGDSLLRRQTPDEWLKKWEGPAEPTIYLQGLVRRALSIMDWEKKISGNILDEPLDLAELLNPDTFLGAFKQQCARKLGISMDELHFTCSWEQTQMHGQNTSCKLTGLLLEGCTFDGLKLMENSPESLPIIKVPDCTVCWVPRSSAERKRNGYTISVPLYYNETRERIIGSLELPSSGEHAKWIQAGVAVFLKT